MTWLLVAVPVAVLLVVVGSVLGLRDLSRRKATTIGTTAYDVVILGLPEVEGLVQLRVGPRSIVVDEPETHRRYDLTATGLTLTRQHGDWSRGGERERLATGRDGRGNDVELSGEHHTMVALWAALHDRPLPVRPQPPVSTPTRDALVGAGFIAGAGLIGLTMAALLTGATSVPGTVIEPGDDDEYCLVEWVSPWSGETLRNEVDCWVEAGEEVTLWALNTPFRGEVWDEDTPVGVGFLAGTFVLIGAGIRGFSRWSTRRRARRAAKRAGETDGIRPSVPPQDEAPPEGTATADGAPTATAPSVELPSADALTYTTARSLMAEVTRARSRRQWSDADVAAWREGRREVARLDRGGAEWWLRVGALMFIPVSALAIGGLLAWTSLDGVLVSRGPSATVEATVEDVVGGAFFIWPDEVDLTFTTATGEQVETLAAVVDGDALASTVIVEHSVAKPFRARVVGDPGPVRGVALSGAGVLLAIGAIGVPVLVRAARRRLALARADRTEPKILAYVLDREPVPPGEVVVDPMGVVVLFDDRGAPAFQLFVAGDELTRAGDAGTAHIRGELHEEAPVRCTLGDVDVTCTSELLYFDPTEWLDDLAVELGDTR